MKFIFITLLFAVFVPAHADMYKCEVNGNTAYQAKPCAADVEEASQFKLKHDISKAERDRARANFMSELADRESEARTVSKQATTDFKQAPGNKTQESTSRNHRSKRKKGSSLAK
jgi:hypothetical protein